MVFSQVPDFVYKVNVKNWKLIYVICGIAYDNSSDIEFRGIICLIKLSSDGGNQFEICTTFLYHLTQFLWCIFKIITFWDNIYITFSSFQPILFSLSQTQRPIAKLEVKEWVGKHKRTFFWYNKCQMIQTLSL